MKLPKTIELLGRTVTIVRDKATADSGRVVEGTYEHSARKVTLNPETEGQELVELLFHECAHGHLTILGWDQKLSKREIELLCQTLTNFAVDMIKGLSKGEQNGRRKNQKRQKPIRSRSKNRRPRRKSAVSSNRKHNLRRS